MIKQVWIVFTKSEPLDGCDIDIDGCDYYCAEAYVPIETSQIHTVSLESIVNRVKQALLDKRLTSSCLGEDILGPYRHNM